MIQNNTQNKRAAEEVDKPLQSEGGNEKMTNKTQEQTQIRGRLLVIDDNPNYALNAVRAARVRGYEVDVAFDLKGAMSYLQSGSYTGIITDLQFYEEGISGSSRISLPDNVDNLEGIVSFQWKWGIDDSGESIRIPAFEKGTEVYEGLIEVLGRTNFESGRLKPKANPELRQRIASELISDRNLSEMQKICSAQPIGLFSMYDDKNFGRELLERELQESPVMGYEVIRYAQEHKIPLAVVTSVGHGQHCIPALLQTGLADADSFVRHNQLRESEQKEVEIECGKNKTESFMSPEWIQWENGKKQRLQVFDSILLDRAILVMEQEKEQHTYDFAIDILEGRIDQTRPYRVEA